VLTSGRCPLGLPALETDRLARIPIATYRLQFGPDFGFVRARDVLGYLQHLGISDVYASPLLMASPGSTHGYDVVDHSRINPELGTAAEFASFTKELKRRGLGLLLDVVPNHMCVATHLNRWWNDVLENGPSSPFAGYFDIEWAAPDPSFAGKLLLPILSDQFGRILEAGQLRIEYQDGSFSLVYADRPLPIAPKTWPQILEPALVALQRQFGEDAPPEVALLESILTAIGYLPPRTEDDPERIRERTREKEVIKVRLAALLDESDLVRSAVAREIDDINGRPGVPASFDRLETLLLGQAYRIAYWRVAADEINYRRFFDVNELAALRVEDPEVFAAAHEVILRLVHAGQVTGLRIDHVDGLFDPTGYLVALQEQCHRAVDIPSHVRPRSSVADGNGCYIVVEKILAENETLPTEWPVHGTTGYDFLNLVGGVFVDRAGARRLQSAYQELTATAQAFSEQVYECKKLNLRHSMSSQVAMLAGRLDRISNQHRHSRDFTLLSLHEALIEVIACLPVYRTYLNPASESLSDLDRGWIYQAVALARRRNAAMNESVFNFVGSVLTLNFPEDLTTEDREVRCDFVLRVQQFTGGVMAKSVEDTAFYRYAPLASCAEVGGSPDDIGVSVEAWHRHNERRLNTSPDSLLASSTHDTKRGEDVRARIRVLSEIPGRWLEAFGWFRQTNARHRTQLPEGETPHVNEEYLLYQTLIGAWPFEPLDDDKGREVFVRRIQSYMQKALREAKVHSSWLSPNEVWEEGVGRFIERILAPSPENAFLQSFASLAQTVASVAVHGSLAQTVLKLTAPGVPDFYQGTELWDLKLVDPDNRSLVDFDVRRQVLDSLRNPMNGVELAARLLEQPGDGRIKMFVTHRTLAARQRQPSVFARGQYVPLMAKGPRAKHIVSFGRVLDRKAVIVVTGRLFAQLGAAERAPVGTNVWADTRIILAEGVPRGTYRDVLTGCQHIVERGRGARLQSAAVLGHLPVAVLELIS